MVAETNRLDWRDWRFLDWLFWRPDRLAGLKGQGEKFRFGRGQMLYRVGKSFDDCRTCRGDVPAALRCLVCAAASGVILILVFSLNLHSIQRRYDDLEIRRMTLLDV